MRLSFNIPTYNRAKFLQNNIELLASQIIDLGKESDVEINICDNASTDETREICEAFIKKYCSLSVNYYHSDSNLGPDRNFIKAMECANGEYSLLWGDDDYLKEGGLRRIFELTDIGDKNDVQILLSATTIIDKDKKFLREKPFLRNDIDEIIVDFSYLSQARAYFFLLKDMGGMLSFISDVVYKTSIIRDNEYNQGSDDRVS